MPYESTGKRYTTHVDPFGNLEINEETYTPHGSGRPMPLWASILFWPLAILLLAFVYVFLPSLLVIDSAVPEPSLTLCIAVLAAAVILSAAAAVVYGKKKKRYEKEYTGFLGASALTFGVTIVLAVVAYVVYMEMTMMGKTFSDLFTVRYGNGFWDGLGNYLLYLLCTGALCVASAIAGIVISFFPWLFLRRK